MSKFKGVEFTEVEREVVKVEKLDVPSFVFEFSEEEVAYLHAILGAVGGSPSESPRGIGNELFDQICNLVDSGEVEPMASPEEYAESVLFTKYEDHVQFDTYEAIDAKRKCKNDFTTRNDFFNFEDSL